MESGNYGNKSFNELRALAKSRGIPASGSRVEIIGRLIRADAETLEVPAPEPIVTAPIVVPTVPEVPIVVPTPPTELAPEPTEPIELPKAHSVFVETAIGNTYTFQWNGSETVDALARYIERSGGPVASRQRIYHLGRQKFIIGDVIRPDGAIGKLTGPLTALVPRGTYFMQPTPK